jgi:hypothetical protein
MTSRFFWLLCILLTLGTTAQARSKSEQRDTAAVFQAQRLLDESTWSETIRIRNVKPNSVFRSKVMALAFEFGGRVWLYIPQIGTQSPAVTVSQLASDKADLSDLISEVNAGFVSYEKVQPDAKVIAAIAKRDDVPNACLMESLATLRKMVRSGVDVEQADLLMYYAFVGSNVVGHTVLVYETDEGRFVWDPVKPKRARQIREAAEASPMAIARVVADAGVRSKLSQARLLNIAESDMGATYVAGLDRRHFANLVN